MYITALIGFMVHHYCIFNIFIQKHIYLTKWFPFILATLNTDFTSECYVDILILETADHFKQTSTNQTLKRAPHAEENKRVQLQQRMEVTGYNCQAITSQ